MSKEREAELEDNLANLKHQETAKIIVELLAIRRERYRDRLEKEENAVFRGKAQECSELIQLFD